MWQPLNGRLTAELLVDFLQLFDHTIHQPVHYAVNSGLPSISWMIECQFREAAYDYGLHRKNHELVGIGIGLTLNYLSAEVTCLQIRQIEELFLEPPFLLNRIAFFSQWLQSRFHIRLLSFPPKYSTVVCSEPAEGLQMRISLKLKSGTVHQVVTFMFDIVLFQ